MCTLPQLVPALLVALAVHGTAPVSPAASPSTPPPATSPFAPADLMTLGVYYYPEAWPAEQWPRDIANIRKLGMEFIHFGEFAWALLEPNEGQYDFAWLDRAIALSAEQGLKVILCTPSATPPVWLTEKHPDVLMVNAAGRTMAHGTRQHATWSSDVYRGYVAKIVHELGRRYGNDPRIWGWQLDNELSHYNKDPDLSAASQRKFQAWLQQRYGSIDRLNRAWGTTFWSQVYQRFEQVRLPNVQEYIGQFNPQQMLDAQRWYAEEAADYLRFQAGILRQYCGTKQWVTTNYMHNFAPVDPVLNTGDFEAFAWTHYPVHGNPNRGPLGYRLGDPYVLSFAGDFYRSLNGNAGVMELQPGQVNWGEVNPQPYPGAVRMWLLRTFATGSKFACTYRYRQPLVGAEMFHYGLVGTDGVTPTNGGEQFAQVAREIASLRKAATPGASAPAAYAARRTAILYSYENRWDLDNHRQNKAWDTYEHVLKYYAAAKRAGAPVDILPPDRDWSDYPLVVAPAFEMVDDALVRRWREYAEKGGHLILTCRTGQKDRDSHFREGPWAAAILDLIGAEIRFYDTLPAPNTAKVAVGSDTFAWSTWGDVLAPRETGGTTILATYADQYYAGAPAAITRQLGSGTVTYLGVDSVSGDFEARMVRDAFVRAGVTPADFADGFLVDWRDGLWIATNFTEKPQPAPVPAKGRILIGERTVPIAGVTVWQE